MAWGSVCTLKLHSSKFKFQCHLLCKVLNLHEPQISHFFLFLKLFFRELCRAVRFLVLKWGQWYLSSRIARIQSDYNCKVIFKSLQQNLSYSFSQILFFFFCCMIMWSDFHRFKLKPISCWKKSWWAKSLFCPITLLKRELSRLFSILNKTTFL